jgi:hypothetical protein
VYSATGVFTVTELAIAGHESSARVSILAFQATPRFTLEVGRARERISLKHEVVKKLKDVIDSAGGFISAWQDYLNVDGLHSESCLKAAFTTVSEAAAIFRELCELWEHRRSLWSSSMQEKLIAVLEQVEDIQENLALLIDDEARDELRNILIEAGLDGRALVREDAKTS